MIIFLVLRAHARVVLEYLDRGMTFKNLDKIPKSGPLLIAPTHANSIIDALMVACYIKRPTWFLARGDVFKKAKWLVPFLTSIKIKPIFRPSEGKENMSENEITMAACIELFEKNESVLIFPEGICANQEQLLPLKKGMGRMAWMAKEKGIDLQISPVTVIYDDFKSFGHRGMVSVADTINIKDFEANESRFVKTLMDKTSDALTSGFDYDFKPKFNLRLIPLAIGCLINLPLYIPIWIFAKLKMQNTVFFQSSIVMLLFLIFPIYWLTLIIILFNLI